MVCTVFDCLMDSAKAAKVKHRHIARLLGVRNVDFKSWASCGVPTEYLNDAMELAVQLDELVRAGKLPRTQNDLAVLGLVSLANR